MAAVDRNREALQDFFNPSYGSDCQDAVLTGVLATMDTGKSLDFADLTSAKEGETSRVTVKAGGPWGDDGVFVARYDQQSDKSGEGEKQVQPFLVDPLLFECLRSGASLAFEKWNELSPRLKDTFHDLEILNLGEEEELKKLIEEMDSIVAELGVGLDGISENEDYTGRLELLAPPSGLLDDVQNVESELPGLEAIVPSTLDECRAEFYSRQQCAELGLAPPVSYTGPYAFSGEGKSKTNNFCLTADAVTIEYSAQGIGRFPDIYSLSIWLYEEEGDYVDAAIGLEGSGHVSFATPGEACYYLELEPFEARWTVTVSQ